MGATIAWAIVPSIVHTQSSVAHYQASSILHLYRYANAVITIFHYYAYRNTHTYISTYTFQRVECVVPENIHTNPKEGKF